MMTNLPKLKSLENPVHSNSSNQGLTQLFNNISILVADFLSALKTKSNVTKPEYGWWNKFDHSDSVDQFPNRKVLEFNNRIFIYLQPKVGDKEEYQDDWFHSVALIIGRDEHIRRLIKNSCLFRNLTRKIYIKLMKVKLKKMPQTVALQPCREAPQPLLKKLRVMLTRVSSLDLQARRLQKNAVADRKVDNESAIKRQLSFDSAKLLPAKKFKYADYIREYNLRECSVVLSSIKTGHSSSVVTDNKPDDDFCIVSECKERKQCEKLEGLPQEKLFDGLNNNLVSKTEVVFTDKNVSKSVSVSKSTQAVSPVPISKALTKPLLPLAQKSSGSTSPIKGLKTTSTPTQIKKPFKISTKTTENSKAKSVASDKFAVPLAKKASPSESSKPKSVASSQVLVKKPVESSKPSEAKPLVPLVKKSSGSSGTPSGASKTKSVTTSTKAVPPAKKPVIIKPARSLPKTTSGGCTAPIKAATTKSSTCTKKTSASTTSETSKTKSEVTSNSTQSQIKNICKIFKSTSEGNLSAKESPKSRVNAINTPKIPTHNRTGDSHSNDKVLPKTSGTSINNGTKTPPGEAAKCDFLKNFTIPKIRNSKEPEKRPVVSNQPLNCDKALTTNSRDVLEKFESSENVKNGSKCSPPDVSVIVMTQETQDHEKKSLLPENHGTGRLVSSVGPLLEKSETLLMVEIKNDDRSMQQSPPAKLMPICSDSVSSDNLDCQKTVKQRLSHSHPQQNENTNKSVALSTDSKSSNSAVRIVEVRNDLNEQGLKNLPSLEKHPSFSKNTRAVSSDESDTLFVVEVKNDLNTQKVEQVPSTVKQRLAPKTDRTVVSATSKAENSNALFLVEVKNDLATTKSEIPAPTPVQDLQPPKNSVRVDSDTSVPAETSNQSKKDTSPNGNESKWGAPNGGYEFISQDPLENSDNYDAGWNDMKNVENVAERYRMIRKRWRNLAIPDPNKNLTFRHSRRAHLSPKPQRDFRNCYQVDRSDRQRSLSCSSIYEFMICKAKAEAQMALLNLEQKKLDDRLSLFDSYRYQFYNFEVMNRQDWELNNLNQRHNEMRWRIEQQLEKEIKGYEMYINEIRSFHSFYQGLDENDSSDKMQLLPEQVDLIQDIANHYEVYAQIYKR